MSKPLKHELQLNNIGVLAYKLDDMFDGYDFTFISCSGYRLASAKAAQHRLDWGVWTSVHFGDMRRALSDPVSNLEKDAVKKLIVRLNLIAMEEGWTRPLHVRNYLGNNSEPW
ncbi:hypothetical protein PVK06_012133 [Gossypium arboreum]|uniref:Uncharacterized protein n=1 Tax=Gossypium arboreum TaxID=29729 RepID=A0ABR0QBU0_GOSAR|nr:hypothetical protein PVK06_012133 [Gossypium arboreum]